jgi:DNA processing protein
VTIAAAAGSATGVPDPHRLALAGLSRIAEPGDPAVFRAVQLHGPERVWEALRRGQPVGQVSQDVLPGLAARADGHDPRVDLDAAARTGARLLCPGDPEWPAARLHWTPGGLLDPPPLALWVRGAWPLDEAVERSVAVVGARAASSYGLHVAGELAVGLAQGRAAVVSGGAYGIDAAAHRGALVAGTTPTVAVLACGVDVAYPRGNHRLLREIAEQGLVVSELPPGSHPTRRRFLVRNRLIAALSLGTVVVEAALRSGSLATLERARLLGRHVMAVPGPVTSGMSSGCHQELRNGAVCVTRAAEVLELVGRLGEDAADVLRGPVDVRDGLSETVRRVLEAVPVRRSAGVAALAKEAGVSALVVQQVLPPLQAHGLVQRTEDGWRLTPLGAGRGPSSRGA